LLTQTRRTLLQRTGFGLGGFALASLLAEEQPRGASPAASRRSTGTPGPHFAPRAKRVIYIHLVGAPSHLDLFESKPELQRRSGEMCPQEFFAGKQFAFIRERPPLLGTPQKESFAVPRCGEAGHTISNLLPHLQSVSDELAFVRSLHTDEFNHAPAQLFLLTGFGQFGRPSIGSWASYGLGTENRDLPSFVVLVTGRVLGAGNSAWGSGFLPTVHQGVEFRSQGDPVLFLSDPPGVNRQSRGDIIDTVNQLNQVRLGDIGNPEIATRISQYELAYRMQASVPELMRIDDEPAHIHRLYGTQPGKTSFANHCLLARRLVERGVRFVQLFDQGWDHHGSVFAGLQRKAKQVDRPIAALIRDLRQRGLLDETLVVWSAEFGRTPIGQNAGATGNKTKTGRDHHKDAYTIWMAGGGVRRGASVGSSDPLGFSITEAPVHVHDLNASIMHLMGIDHERLTFRYQGRQFRLTDVEGRIVQPLLG
jgi:hypothetical protein